MKDKDDGLVSFKSTDTFVVVSVIFHEEFNHNRQFFRVPTFFESIYEHMYQRILTADTLNNEKNVKFWN